LSVTRRMDELARGALDVRALALHLGLAAVALAVATAAVARGAAPPSTRRRHAVQVVLVAALAVAANVAAARHPLRLDLTRARHRGGRAAGGPRRRAPRPAPLPLRGRRRGPPADPYDEVRDLAERMAARAPALVVDAIGEGDGDRVRALAARYHLADDDLVEG